MIDLRWRKDFINFLWLQLFRVICKNLKCFNVLDNAVVFSRSWQQNVSWHLIHLPLDEFTYLVYQECGVSQGFTVTWIKA